jgi:hypothetical protein
VTHRYQASSAALASRIVDGEAVLLSHTTHHCYALNGTGTEIWQALSQAGGASLEELCALWPQASCRSDVESLIQELACEGLIEPSPLSGAAFEQAVVASTSPYARPFLESYEKLEQLILSGE